MAESHLRIGYSACMFLPFPVDNPTLCQVIGRKCYTHCVTRNNPDIVFSHLARKMGEDNMLVLKFHTEHRIGKSFAYDPFHFNCFFFGHKALQISAVKLNNYKLYMLFCQHEPILPIYPSTP